MNLSQLSLKEYMDHIKDRMWAAQHGGQSPTSLDRASVHYAGLLTVAQREEAREDHLREVMEVLRRGARLSLRVIEEHPELAGKVIVAGGMVSLPSAVRRRRA